MRAGAVAHNGGMPITRVVDLDGHVFRVFSTERPGSGRAFLLVHGIGISHRLFSRLHGVLARHHSVHTVDLPGFGGLPKPASSPDVARMAEMLGGVVGDLGEEAAVAVGDSMGTQWVVELGAQRPDLVSHVATIGPVVDDRHRTAFAQALALGVDSTRETPSANVRVLTEYLRCGPRWYLRQLPHMLEYPMEERVGDLTQPLLVLRGGRDPIAGADWCAKLTRRAQRSRSVTVPGHPHLVQHTAPRAVASALDWFLGVGEP